MKIQLIILAASFKKFAPQIIMTITTFFMPIFGLSMLIGFVIGLDTVTGIWKAKKNKIPVTSRGASAIASKMALYQVTLFTFFLIDHFIMNDIMKQFFSVNLMLTKVVSLILISIEVMSINENYKAVKGLDLCQAMKNLFARAKEIKNDIDGIRHNQNSTGPTI